MTRQAQRDAGTGAVAKVSDADRDSLSDLDMKDFVQSEQPDATTPNGVALSEEDRGAGSLLDDPLAGDPLAGDLFLDDGGELLDDGGDLPGGSFVEGSQPEGSLVEGALVEEGPDVVLDAEHEALDVREHDLDLEASDDDVAQDELSGAVPRD